MPLCRCPSRQALISISSLECFPTSETFVLCARFRVGSLEPLASVAPSSFSPASSLQSVSIWGQCSGASPFMLWLIAFPLRGIAASGVLAFCCAYLWFPRPLPGVVSNATVFCVSLVVRGRLSTRLGIPSVSCLPSVIPRFYQCAWGATPMSCSLYGYQGSL